MQNVKQAFPDRTPQYAGKMLDGPERSRMRTILLEAGQSTVGLTDQQLIGKVRILKPDDRLEKFITRPNKGIAKRRMLAVDPVSYQFITDTADQLDTTRGRMVVALIAFYKAHQ